MLYYIKLQYELPSNPRIIFGGLKGLFIEFLELYMCNCSSNDNIHGSDYLLIFNDAQKFDEAKQIMNEESAFNNSKIIFGNISSPEMKLQLQMNTIKINGKTTKNTDITKNTKISTNEHNQTNNNNNETLSTLSTLSTKLSVPINAPTSNLDYQHNILTYCCDKIHQFNHKIISIDATHITKYRIVYYKKKNADNNIMFNDDRFRILYCGDYNIKYIKNNQTNTIPIRINKSNNENHQQNIYHNNIILGKIDKDNKSLLLEPKIQNKLITSNVQNNIPLNICPSGQTISEEFDSLEELNNSEESNEDEKEDTNDEIKKYKKCMYHQFEHKIISITPTYGQKQLFKCNPRSKMEKNIKIKDLEFRILYCGDYIIQFIENNITREELINITK